MCDSGLGHGWPVPRSTGMCDSGLGYRKPGSLKPGAGNSALPARIDPGRLPDRPRAQTSRILLDCSDLTY